MTVKGHRAIVIPADPAVPCRAGWIPAGGNLELLQRLVGGDIEVARYDPDAYFLVNETGAIEGLPVNERVTRYVHEHSNRAAQLRERGRRFPPDYLIHGDAVLVGTNGGMDADVPQRFYDTFAVPIRRIEELGPAGPAIEQ